jgi:uncharacterized membrane protein
MRALYLGASGSLVALILLCVFWELFLAPLRPGGSWLVLKALPLLLPLRGVLAGRRYTYQWASMLIMIYFTEGTVRAFSDTGPSRALAAAEIVLATTFFLCAIFYARATGRASR